MRLMRRAALRVMGFSEVGVGCVSGGQAGENGWVDEKTRRVWGREKLHVHVGVATGWSWHGRYVCRRAQPRTVSGKTLSPLISLLFLFWKLELSSREITMEIVLGCVGKPSAGKSTFFNGVSEGKAKTGNFPFTTIEPNVGISYYRVDCPCVRKVRRGCGDTTRRERDVPPRGNPARPVLVWRVRGGRGSLLHGPRVCHVYPPSSSLPFLPGLSPLTPITAATSPPHRARRRSVRPSTGGATGSGGGSSR